MFSFFLIQAGLLAQNEVARAREIRFASAMMGSSCQAGAAFWHEGYLPSSWQLPKLIPQNISASNIQLNISKRTTVSQT